MKDRYRVSCKPMTSEEYFENLAKFGGSAKTLINTKYKEKMQQIDNIAKVADLICNDAANQLNFIKVVKLICSIITN